MTLQMIFDLIHEEQDVFLHYECFDVRGTCGSLSGMLADEICNGNVIDIAAEGGTLIVWAKEAVGNGNA